MAVNFRNAAKNELMVADFLRSAEAELTIKQGVLDGRRVDYFKGKHAVNALLRDPHKKKSKRPVLENRTMAEALLSEMHSHGFFLKVEKAAKAKQQNLALVQDQSSFEPEAYYVWIYEGSQLKGMLIGTGVLLVAFAGVMFPLWPARLRDGVYYLSLGLLGLIGLFICLSIFRLALWLVLKVATGRDGWLYPQLFADVGIIESFSPVWGWDEPKHKRRSAKVAAAAVAGSGSDGDFNDHED
ncbi:Translocation protein S62 [Geranomyces michiganensis]|nr:Translocation protein S62 [Geranomyces michiganensis]